LSALFAEHVRSSAALAKLKLKLAMAIDDAMTKNVRMHFLQYKCHCFIEISLF